jgi:CheY-like chemotaxis protein
MIVVASKQHAFSPEYGNETVLVADDHDSVRETTREILQKLGYRIIVVPDGQEAVREFANLAAEVSLVISLY